MNFLVSKNPVWIDHYWAPLLENGESLLLGDFTELLWRVASAKEGLALVDTQIPGFSGMAEVAHLKRTNQNIRILLLSGSMKAEEELAALAAGAAGSCGPNLLPEKIRQILTTVNNGGVWISSAALPQLLQRLKRWENTTQQKNNGKANGDHEKNIAGLTPREREIVNLIAKGDSNKLIARELNITDRTVKAHLSIIFQKLKVNDRLQLALFANKHMME
jgi:two-component system nitrate/nitrite response regulator NarL